MKTEIEQCSPEWRKDSLKWRGTVLTGKMGHWCNDWDGLPIDETCPEWPCACVRYTFWQRVYRIGFWPWHVITIMDRENVGWRAACRRHHRWVWFG